MKNNTLVGGYFGLGSEATETDIMDAKRNLANQIAEYIVESDAFIVRSPEYYAKANAEEAEIFGHRPLVEQWTVGLKVELFRMKQIPCGFDINVIRQEG